MQKCMINENSTSMSVGTITLSHSSSESSPSHYSGLQFNYNAEHISPLNNMNPCALPLYNHLTRHSDSSSSFLEMHSIAPSNNDASSNTVIQENGYILRDGDFRREADMHTVGYNSADTQLKPEDKTNKATHKTASTNVAVGLKSDGTGIIQTGTLQALIPSSGSDENYTVTPSQTHETYFDVRIHS